MNNIGFSSCQATVAICTYNGRDRIADVLTALGRQTSIDLNWEVLVVDNASTDGTAEVANRFIIDSLNGCGRVVREDQPGLSFARACAAKEARGEIICFLDDDNIPAPDFVSAVIEAFEKRSKAGVIGGKVLARWETEPTPLALAVAPFALAICDLGDTAHRIDGLGGGIVGAGLCVRTELLREIFDSSTLAATVTDRKGTSLISGGDLAISIVARQAGWETWYDPALVIEHVIPESRMREEYLLRLYDGIGRGQAAVRRCYDWKARTPLAWLIGIKDLLRWARGQISRPAGASVEGPIDVAASLHALSQRQICGRALKSLSWPF
jgi:glycosyltransferase involved in cell wall biosynthesis